MESPRASKRRKISTNGPAQMSSPSTDRKVTAPPSSASRSAEKFSRPLRTYGRPRRSHDATTLRSDVSLRDVGDDEADGEKPSSFVDSAYQSRAASRTTPDEPETVSAVDTPSRTLRNGKQAATASSGRRRAGSSKKQTAPKKNGAVASPHAQLAETSRLEEKQPQNYEKVTPRYLEQVDSDTVVVRDSSPLGEEIDAQPEGEPSPTKRSSGRIRRQTRKVQEIAAETPARRRRGGKGDYAESNNQEREKDQGTGKAKRKMVVMENGTGEKKRNSRIRESGEQVGENEQSAVEDGEQDQEDTATDDGEPTFGELLGIHKPSATPTKRLLRGRSNVSPRKKNVQSSTAAVDPTSDQAHAKESTQPDLPFLSPSPRASNGSLRPKGRTKPPSEAQLEDSPSLIIQSSASKAKISPLKLLEDKLQKDQAAPKELEALKTHILNYLTCKHRLPLHGLETEYHKVHQLLEQTVIAGEGNSLLLIGPRGSGKTNLVETAIARIGTSHRDDFHVVRLNGFIHTDDKLALKDIWRQLGREMDVENDATAPSSYADNLTSILALLSHPTEHGGEDADDAMELDSGVTAKSVIFVIDEFDLFTAHSRQTLLYNLFDIAQARKAPIAVLGLTTRVDVVDSLEKRVKSRFSHRHVYVSLAKSLPAFKDICKSALVASEPPHDTRNPFGVGALDLSGQKNSYI